MSQEKEYSLLDKQRHTGAHILASALKKYLEDEKVEVKLAIGPPIDNGFYYDFDLGNRSLTNDDFPKIEKIMAEIVKADYKFERRDASIEEAKKISADQPYKLELISDFASQGTQEVSYYKIGEFEDLCRGNHVDSTSQVGAFKIHKIAGAYWKGDEKNKQLQRVYVLMFGTQTELDDHLTMLEEAEKRDHRKIGKEHGLFVFSELIGPGLPMYTPKGATVRREIIKFSNELNLQTGFQEVHTPNMNKGELFKTSGHYDQYKEDMFKVVSNYTDEEYFLKPMNCPQHTQIYASAQRSYKDLPIRFCDFAMLYRDEKPGQLSGLTRLRAFSQDDGHCFCREDQIESEFEQILGAINIALTTYKMDYHIRLSTRDVVQKEKYLGADEVWEKSEATLENLLKKNNINYVVGVGEAAFYGPKMDIIAHDAIGREWQISTIQLDMNMPGRFNLEYTDADGSKKTPVMIHRAIVGSPDRFMALLIEHYSGNFPTWLAPIQVRILPISDKFMDYAVSVKNELLKNNIRVEIDDRAESVGKKIRQSEVDKVPYAFIIGEKEIAANAVALRKRHDGDKGIFPLTEVIPNLLKEIVDRV